MRLPAIEPPAEPMEQPTAAARVQRRRIVVIEDNEDLRLTLRALLELDGHEVHEAADGKSGAELILRVRPEVALVDVGLPQLDGYGVARAVRSHADFEMRLVAITGYGSTDDRERGLQAGFDTYLVKPVDPNALARLLSAA